MSLHFDSMPIDLIDFSVVGHQASGLRGHDQGQLEYLQPPHPAKDTDSGQTLETDYRWMLVKDQSARPDQ